MKKASKTAAELEAFIKVEMEDICDYPTDMTIVVQPDGNTWKVDVVQEGSGDDLDRREMVKQIAARLKAEYDFEWLKSSISETLEAANRTLWGRQFQMISRASAPTCYNLGSREAYY